MNGNTIAMTPATKAPRAPNNAPIATTKRMFVIASSIRVKLLFFPLVADRG
jgi:hypothetical protein